MQKNTEQFHFPPNDESSLASVFSAESQQIGLKSCYQHGRIFYNRITFDSLGGFSRSVNWLLDPIDNRDKQMSIDIMA